MLTNESILENAINKLVQHSKYVVVKLGSKGSITATKDKRNFIKSFLNDKVVDAIGAGDSFNAGFILNS